MGQWHIIDTKKMCAFIETLCNIIFYFVCQGSQRVTSSHPNTLITVSVNYNSGKESATASMWSFIPWLQCFLFGEDSLLRRLHKSHRLAPLNATVIPQSIYTMRDRTGAGGRGQAVWQAGKMRVYCLSCTVSIYLVSLSHAKYTSWNRCPRSFRVCLCQAALGVREDVMAKK